jgi:hypothetical protein
MNKISIWSCGLLAKSRINRSGEKRGRAERNPRAARP